MVGVSRHAYTVALVPEEGGYVVDVPALPGCVTQGETLTEALLMAEEAITLYLETLADESDPLPVERGPVTVRMGDCCEAFLRKVTVNLTDLAGVRPG